MAVNQIHTQVVPQPAATYPARRPWHVLTRDEQRALLLVLGLFILGIGARAWFAWREPRSAPTASISQPAKETHHAP
jgi:hypothetical protein